MIHFSNVTKFYERQAAIKNITFSVEKGEMVFMTGPSGAGKSTILKIIYLSEKPDEGSVTIAEWDLSKLKESSIPFLRRNIGVVFQDFRLLDNRNVFDNVAMALRIRGMLDSEIQDWVMEILKMVNLRHKADSFPRALSGGEQQRVVIARAIVGERTILLADVPTGNLDPDTAAGITRLFKEVNARGTTVVIATHNRELYRNTGRRVFRIDSGNMVGEEIG
ncbi:MAG TPA: cell division ATP-binding protein FtsE [Nitrospiraceae bacterium]|nr:cell division ATP-binding protein FtsE [Nitrospiraceae bacterium]